MEHRLRKLFLLFMVLCLALPLPALAQGEAPQATINFTILHTNDFHGNLELSGSNPGAARVANAINTVRTAVGAGNVLLFDGGDIMQGSLLSNLQKGLPTIDYYRTIGYNAATFGNHEFDWGQTVLGDRIVQAESPATADEKPVQMVVANIAKKLSDGTCGWDPFAPGVTPYEVFTVGTEPNQVKVGVIGVSSIETPYITVASATEGLCFKDPAESILHYYADLDAASDVIVVLSHNGFLDGGYGYGFTVYGDQTLAKKLNDAGKPANLIIGGHSHTPLDTATVVGTTTVVQAHYAGRRVGRANITFDTVSKAVTVTWSPIIVKVPNPTADPPVPGEPEDPQIKALVQLYANDAEYQTKINLPIGWAQVDLVRNYNGDNLMGSLVNDAIYHELNGDGQSSNDVDVVFNNPGGLRADICKAETCATGLHAEPYLLTYGKMFSVLPFGNQTVTGQMTGAQILELLNQSASLFKGSLQVAGIRFKFYHYKDALAGQQPWAWGAYDVTIRNRTSGAWEALDPAKTYQVATNEFLAPAGQDGFVAFKYFKNPIYWGDMLDQVDSYIAKTFTQTSPYKGPKDNGELDGRILRVGTDTGGDVVPVTVLHHNDSHGRLLYDSANKYAGYTQLATLIKEERAHNPDRTILLTAGDNIQGDSMMYYFKSAGLGKAADGTVLPADMQINPLIKAMNAMNYTAMTLGNHEFNFGPEIFGTLAQANFDLLQANISDTGAYGLAAAGVKPYTTVTLGTAPNQIDVAVLGIGNHRIWNYELPSNIPGLTFSNPIDKGKELAPGLDAANDVVIALTHIGFTGNPKSVEVDNNVDTVFAAQVPGIDAVIGGHSHTDPTRKTDASGDYQYLPTFVAGPDGTPVLINHSNRYNTFLGEVVLGLLPNGEGGYDVVSRAGRNIAVVVDPTKTPTPEDPAIKAIVQPYADLLKAYNEKEIGQTLAPIDTNKAFTEETNGANLQADASVWKLEKEGLQVDFHLSGAMTNRLIANTATPATPYTLKVADMFSAMPYENSLLVLRMNGPQLKKVLERAYRNYYYYKYVPGYGGYSYYTTCMIDINAGGKITYWDSPVNLPHGQNVISLEFDGKKVDFNDAKTFYNVSTVNYLAAGSCNFNDNGQTLWPLDQVVKDTQYYVRDSVTEYIDAQTAAIEPKVEGRLAFVLSARTYFMPFISIKP